MLIQKDIKNIYLGEYTQTDNWILFDETNIAGGTSGGTSTTAIPSKNGKILRTRYLYGGGNGNYTITTFMGYAVCRANNSHGNCYLGTTGTDMQSLLTHKKLKFVIDIIYFGSRPTNYSSGCGGYNNSHISYNYNNGNLWPEFIRNANIFSFGTPYKEEIEFEIQSNTTTITLTNLNTQAVSTASTTTGTPYGVVPTDYQQLVAGGYAIRGINRDQSGGDVYNGNLHIYYTN